MLSNGIYPAAVTPFDEKGRIDLVSTARLLAWFEAGGCRGAVLAGTNGEGPSLSAVEKRDLLKAAMPLKGKLELILGIATSSTDEAVWLCRQAGNDGAVAVLLMAPYYFKEATEAGVAAWFELVMDRSPVPVLIYNFPQRTGFTISPDLLHRLSQHDNYGGAKDSSGLESNIAGYRAATGDKPLFVGNETLIFNALTAGWNGSISGASNAVPMWLSQIVKEFNEDRESAETKFQLLLPVLNKLRSSPQPAMNKALLHAQGVLDRPDLRLPLLGVADKEVDDVLEVIKQQLGPILTRRTPQPHV
jgi:4-hydroxy-tetrahydrodipicolinate synthase